MTGRGSADDVAVAVVANAKCRYSLAAVVRALQPTVPARADTGSDIPEITALGTHRHQPRSISTRQLIAFGPCVSSDVPMSSVSTFAVPAWSVLSGAGFHQAPVAMTATPGSTPSLIARPAKHPPRSLRIFTRSPAFKSRAAASTGLTVTRSAPAILLPC